MVRCSWPTRSLRRIRHSGSCAASMPEGGLLDSAADVVEGLVGEPEHVEVIDHQLRVGVGAENCVVAGQATFRYSWMSRHIESISEFENGGWAWSRRWAGSGARWSSERWGRCWL